MANNIPPNNKTRLTQAGIRAVKAGHNAEARQLLRQALELDDNNEQAWLWLATAVDTPTERRVCLANVLRLNPRNEIARRALAKLNEAESDQSARTASRDSFESLRAPSAAPESPAGRARRPSIGLVLVGILVLVFAGVGGIALSQLGVLPTLGLPPAPTSGVQALLTPLPHLTLVAVVPSAGPPPPATWTPMPSFTPAGGFTPSPTPWPPAKLTLVFAGKSTGHVASNLYLIAADGSGQHALQTGGSASDPAWSPDGTHLAFVGTVNGLPQLAIADADGGHPAILTHFTGSYLRSPAWSPDGKQLAFAATYPDSPTHHAAIYMIQPDGSNLTPLTDGSAESHDPAWSPDGRQITYATDVVGQGSFQIYTLDLSNAQRHVLTNSLNSNFGRRPDLS